MKNLEMKYIHSPIILGIIGGLLGAFFINVNSRLGALRKKIVKSKTKKNNRSYIFCMYYNVNLFYDYMFS